MNAPLQKLRALPNLGFSLLPTPIHRLDRLSDLLGTDLYCKRDDLTGFAMGGNKTRKLDFLVAEAQAQGCDTLIGVGANQSNFCRMTAGYGAAAGLEVHLVLAGKKPAAATGNLLLDHIFGAHIHHVDSADWNEWEKQAARLEKELTAGGRRVYRMPIGGSTPTGAYGYVAAMAEITEQCRTLGLTFDTIVHASSSVGTQAGLVVGQALTGWQGTIIGMAVAADAEQLRQSVHELAGRTADMLGITYDPDTVIVDDGYLGDAYAARTEAAAEAIGLFAKHEGIVLDHVYSGKAAAGLVDYARQGRFQANSKVLFLHTGGSVEIFE